MVKVSLSIGFMRIACFAVARLLTATFAHGSELREGGRLNLWLCLALGGLLWFGALAVRAADYYVVPYNTTQASPYTNWDTAGTNIIDVVNAAMTNTAPRTVWVSNGVYVLTNQIVITNALTLRSTNGPDVTLVNGNFVAGAPETNRCLWMSNVSAFVHGFTFSNGARETSDGGGVWMYSGILSNCVVRDNKIFAPTNLQYGGGGVYAYGGTVTACRIIGNMVTNTDITPMLGRGRAGGMYIRGGGYVVGCLISNNVIAWGGNSCQGGGIYLQASSRIGSSTICNNDMWRGDGAGAYLELNSTMEDCTVAASTRSSPIPANSAIFIYQGGTITNCVFSNNLGGLDLYPANVNYICAVFNTTFASNSWGVRCYSSAGEQKIINCVIANNTSNGVVFNNTNDMLLNCEVRGNNFGGVLSRGGIIRNCLIANNTTNGGILIGSPNLITSVSGCTIVNNRSALAGAGIRFAATNSAITVSSCVIYSNGVAGADDVYNVYAPTNYGALQYSCIGSNPGFTGAGIIVANPQFKDFAGGNYRLSANSPCINTGSNEPSWMTNSVDLDGRMRIRYGTVDMGAYELLHGGTIFTFH